MRRGPARRSSPSLLLRGSPTVFGEFVGQRRVVLVHLLGDCVTQPPRLLCARLQTKYTIGLHTEVYLHASLETSCLPHLLRDSQSALRGYCRLGRDRVACRTHGSSMPG